MDIILNSFVFVALTEMGDKTQLLAFVLASRFKKPWTIFFGIFVATVLNHLLAAWAGRFVSDLIPHLYLKWILALTFIGFAIWVMIPDKDEGLNEKRKWGALLTTIVTFFIAEMGDKTQLATVALAAKYNDLGLVTIGSTLGMMVTSGLAVFFGDKMTKKIPMKWVHALAALFYVIFAIAIVVKG